MAVYSKSLSNRSNDFEWSQIEFLNIKRDNQGFVRPVPNTHSLGFYLDPSKFKKADEFEIYVVKRNVSIPKPGSFIEVTVAEEEDVPYYEKVGNWDNFYSGQDQYIGYKNPKTIKYKYISGWEFKDIKKLLFEDFRFQDLKDRFYDYITGSFKAPPDDMKTIGTCLSMRCASTPPFDGLKGGIDISVFGKQRHWTAFNRSNNFIRSEFRKPSFDYFFKSLKKNENPNISKCIEVNRAYKNMQEVSITLPLIFPGDFEKRDFFKDRNLTYKPYAQAFMIDMLHIDPIIPPELNKFIENRYYEIINDIINIKAGKIPYNQDIGSLVPKLSTSMARTNFSLEPTKEDIDKSLDAWAQEFYLSLRFIKSRLDNEQLFKLSPDARTLYVELEDRQDTGMSMKVVDVKRDSKVFEWNFDDALQELVKAGIVFRPNLYEVRVVNLKQ